MSARAQDLVRDELYIGGSWRRLQNVGAIDVINPTTEEVMGRIPTASVAHVDEAVAAAGVAFDAWSTTPVRERAKFCTAISAGILARGDELAMLITAELGMPLAQSRRIQVDRPAATFASMEALIDEITWQERIGSSLITREPVGVVAAITPWNFPLHQIAAKVAPAIAAGCTVVLKPSHIAPLNAFLLAEIIDDAGLPDGVFNLVTGPGESVGEALVSHDRVDMVTFTGSTRAGRRVSELASRTVKPVALELGGKSANVILDDADIEAAITDGLGKCFINSGQTCSALTRMLVPREYIGQAERIAAAAAQNWTVGNPFAPDTQLGPLVSAAQRDVVREYIEIGVADGAKLIVGGSEPPDGLDRGYFIRPTIFSNVANSMRIAVDEIFGPVLAMIPYDGESHAIEIANDTPYGLSGGVWSGSDERAVDVARRLRTGQVSINGGPFNLMAPFGGYKQSGHGRELGRFGLEEFLQVKAMQFK